MKTLFLFLLFVFLVPLTGTSPLLAQWVQTNGPHADMVNALAVIGSNLIAGSGDGIFLSSDGGTNWTWADSVRRDTKTLIVSGINLYAGTGGGYVGGVSLSTNNGVTWTSADSGMPPNTTVWALIVICLSPLAGRISSQARVAVAYFSLRMMEQAGLQ